MVHKIKSIAFVLRDPLPAKRADVLTLFGKELVKHGFRALLIGQSGGSGEAVAFNGGAVYAVGNMKSRLNSLLSPLWDMLGLVRALRANAVDCIQVRDKIASAVTCLLLARLMRVPFVYWMSFPMVEGHETRARELGRSKGWLVWCANGVRARLSRVVFYGLVIRHADHVFVQSDAMRDWMARQGVAPERMTAVPMGVDLQSFRREDIVPASDARFEGRRVLVYVGVLGKARNSLFLLDLLAALRQRQPAILLVLAGDAASADERLWIRQQIALRRLDEHVLITGWLEQAEALRYALRAEVALSPVPRGTLFDVSSPTKLVEYLALGVPCVANDIPDQQLVIERSGAGLCVPMEVAPFCDAVLAILADPGFGARCRVAGPAYVFAERSYDILGRQVAASYDALLRR